VRDNLKAWSVDASKDVTADVKCRDCGRLSKHFHFERYDEYLETVLDNVTAKGYPCKWCEGKNTEVRQMIAMVYVDNET